MHFSNIDQDVSNLVFSFNVWDSIEIDQPLSFENQIGIIENKTPIYVDELNGFATFALDSPILVSDDFYIGWSQTDSRNLQIGFDMNSPKGRANMFTYTNSTWRASAINETGSPMIRAVLDPDFDFNVPSSIRDVYAFAELNIYPNPSSGMFRLKLNNDQLNNQVQVFDLSGKLVLAESNATELDLSSFNDGMYLMQMQAGDKLYRAKLVKY